MNKRWSGLLLTFSMLLIMLPLGVLTAFANGEIVYGDADGTSKVNPQDFNLVEESLVCDTDVFGRKFPTETDINANNLVDETDILPIKQYRNKDFDILMPAICPLTFQTNVRGGTTPIPVMQIDCFRTGNPSDASLLKSSKGSDRIAGMPEQEITNSGKIITLRFFAEKATMGKDPYIYKNEIHNNYKDRIHTVLGAANPAKMPVEPEANQNGFIVVIAIITVISIVASGTAVFVYFHQKRK